MPTAFHSPWPCNLPTVIIPDGSRWTTSLPATEIQVSKTWCFQLAWPRELIKDLLTDLWKSLGVGSCHLAKVLSREPFFRHAASCREIHSTMSPINFHFTFPFCDVALNPPFISHTLGEANGRQSHVSNSLTFNILKKQHPPLQDSPGRPWKAFYSCFHHHTIKRIGAPISRRSAP